MSRRERATSSEPANQWIGVALGSAALETGPTLEIIVPDTVVPSSILSIVRYALYGLGLTAVFLGARGASGAIREEGEVFEAVEMRRPPVTAIESTENRYMARPGINTEILDV